MTELGDEVKCNLTGFKGIVTAKANYLHGCIRCIVTSKNINPETGPVEFWFDEPQLEVIKKKKVKKATKPRHGPRSYQV